VGLSSSSCGAGRWPRERAVRDELKEQNARQPDLEKRYAKQEGDRKKREEQAREERKREEIERAVELQGGFHF